MVEKKKIFEARSIIFLLFLILSQFLVFISRNNTILRREIYVDRQIEDDYRNPKISSLLGIINLTNNYAINNTNLSHYSEITIKGKMYETVGLINLTGEYNVSIVVDGTFYPQFNNTADPNGNFQINFTIPDTLSISPGHILQVDCIDELDLNTFFLNNSFIINILPFVKVNLTNSEVHDKQYSHNSSVLIKGNVSYYLNNSAISGYNVAVLAGGDLYSGFNDITDAFGDFQINFTIPSSWDLYSTYTIQVTITEPIPSGDKFLLNNFTFNIVPFAKLILSNYAFYDTPHYYGTTASIEGRIYEYLNNSIAVPGIPVALSIDGQLNPQYNDITDANGNFQIFYPISPNLDISQGHRVEVNVTQEMWINETEIVTPGYFTLYTNATTVLNITGFDSGLKIPGEEFHIQGYLRYGNYLSGAGIPNVDINYFWYNASFSWPINTFTSDVNGSFSQDLRIPSNVYSTTINLKTIFPGNPTNIDSSQFNISNIKLFSNITCIWRNIESDATEGTNITIAGQIISSNNNSLFISNRTLSILYNGVRVGSVNTDENGDFTFTYTLPEGTGNKSIQVELLNSAGITLDSIIVLNVTTEEFVADVSTAAPPFLDFSLVFFPILIGIIVGLAVYGYRRYKKQEKKSRVVTIVLDLKFLNLKILKESGRLEESLSYLFNAIFMTLIEAKYGRVREENETIRDFAIVSVKELKLTPAAIYPFIQKVEAIIYGTPFKIKENEFYKTCELFSPLYFELTGNNFILNF